MRFLFTIISFALVTSTFSQADTTLYYFNTEYRQTTADSAVIVLKMYKSNEQWKGTETYKRSGILKSEGAYIAKDPKTPVGSFKNFNEKGVLDYEAVWGSESKIQTKTTY
ncbi:MAG: hypothetical protein LH478_03260 [Chitinophagaceae bacterium]|nr:hypothetical protein [Chitinophagaceae bacterium]